MTYLHASPPELGSLFVPYSFLNHCDALAIGCIAAFLAARQHPLWRSVVTSKGVVALGGLLVLVPQALSLMFLLGPLTVPFGPTLQAVGIAVCLLASVESPEWGAFRWLNNRAVVQIGVLSYSIYIWQMLFCSDPLGFGLSPTTLLSFPLWILSAVAVASLSYYALEKPLISLRARWRLIS